MLPVPGSPASSISIYNARLRAIFAGADPYVCAAFWLFGSVNNILYIVILAAALDLVGPAVPKGIVLLADIIPGFIVKLIAPYFIHVVPYRSRIPAFAAGSCCGMLLIALTPGSKSAGAIAVKMVGVGLASACSGGGELSFLGLTHYYDQFSLAAWSSGTGAAGLLGAGLYVLATTVIGLSIRTSLLAFSLLPAIMVGSFFLVLPQGPLRRSTGSQTSYQRVEVDEEEEENDDHSEHLLGSDSLLRAPTATGTKSQRHLYSVWISFKHNLARSRNLFWPYMVPLLLVYISEYTINQGVAPTLLFPLKSSPFSEYRSFYPTYNAIYQMGVFLSRSSTPFFRIHNLYTPSLLQVINLILLTLHALFNFIPSVWIVFGFIFWEGLLGGIVYVSTFAEITDNVPQKDREFSLTATTVSDSGGICIAGFLSMAFEVWLCNWQARHGRGYCKKVLV
ncbi:putative Golgi integral membrane protein [Viridothelium virens]|uniref:Protein BTN n=1 Tax=Viridothelium virens TaxID=1048519 RepID=A0A6A6HFM5_VIRVR|nr:putative Golgi integral membrane protein [Viridothelium virens]